MISENQESKSPPLRQAQGRRCRTNFDKGWAPSRAFFLFLFLFLLCGACAAQKRLGWGTLERRSDPLCPL